MSYSTIYGIARRRLPVEIAEFVNSWGTAPVVWDALLRQHLGRDGWTFMDEHQPLWALFDKSEIPRHHRAVLGMTFDRMILARKNWPEAAADIEKFLADFPPVPGKANHWKVIAELLRKEHERPYIGLQCTSVAENVYQDYDERRDRVVTIPFDKHFNVYEEMVP